MSLVTPVDVSLCTTATALIALAAIGARASADAAGVDAVAPVAGHEVDLEAEPLGHVAPERGEVAGLEHQHACRPATAC